MILTSQDQLKNLDNVGAVLVYPSKITTSGLIQSAISNDLVVNCIVDEDPDNAFVGKSLSALGYPTGCYIVINYQSKKDVKDITGAFSNNLQLGYRAAIIINKSDYTQDDFKAFSQYGIIVIDHNDVKNHILTVPEFLTYRSLAMIRDYTNVDISNVGPGAFVGVGKDTSGLGGGRSFGYSTNGQDFYAVITPKGLVFRQIDALRMWRLLKPQQAAQIGDFFNNKVAKEIEAQNESLKSAVATANSAVNAANQAVNDSKVNSDAINAMKSATSSAKSDADTAMQQATSAVSAISAQIAEVEKSVADTNSANKSAIDALKGNISDAQQTISDVSKNLSTVSANLDTYAKSAAEQGNDITSLKNQQGKLEADMASVSGNVAQLTATTDKLQANIKDNSGNIASLQETASQTAVSIQNAQSQVASVIATAGQLQSLITDQNKQITSIQQTASAASVSASDAKSNAVQAQLTASAATVVAGNAKAEALSVSATASEAKLTATNASSQAMQANATASSVSVSLKAVEDTAKANSDKVDSNAQQLSAVSQKVTTNEANISATQKQIEAKADQVTVDNLNKTVRSQAGEIQANANGLLLKADKTVTDSLNKSVQKQQAQQKILADQITSKVSSADVEKMVDGKGFATKDLVESSITQTSGKINETITNLQGNLQNVTADLTGLQSTVRDKADQSQITQLTNVVQSKVSSKDYQTAISQLTDDINAKVAKGDLISQLNMEAGQTLIQSKKLFLDADSVVFSGKAFIPDAAIENLSLDKLTAGHITVPIADKYGNQIELGNDGINIISGLVVEDSTNSDSNSSDSNVSDTTTVSTDELTNLAASPATALNTALFIDNQPNNTGTISNQPDNPNSSSSASSSAGSASSGSDSDSFQKIGYGVKLTANGLKMYQHRQYAKTTRAEPKSEDFTLLDVNPIKSPVSNDSKKLPEGLAFMIQTQKYSSVLGPETPHNFLALGRRYYNDATDDTGTDFYDVVYSAEDGNGYPVGLHVNAPLYIKPYGADHGIRTAWVSWSNWDGGQKYPAIVNDTANWGGIAFPSSGKATIFDASGHAFWPTQSYGTYNGYGG